MAEEKKKEIIGYYTDDRNIYCVDCILKNQETIQKKIEKAITVDDTGEELIFCDDCKKEIK
jgi:mannose/fructose-specific phosphotransferase system component IIA